MSDYTPPAYVENQRYCRHLRCQIGRLEDLAYAAALLPKRRAELMACMRKINRDTEVVCTQIPRLAHYPPHHQFPFARPQGEPK